MLGVPESNLYEVTYSLGGDSFQTRTISVPEREGRPGKGKALQLLDDPQLMMVPREDIRVKSITKVSEEEAGGFGY